RDRLLLRIWEERLWSLGRPDPAELERYFDLDPDLTAARDLLEVPERYRDLAVPRPPVPTPLGWQLRAEDSGER
ncbi:MAG TPA: hypothetical protein VM118_06065, partial [Acidobacteriota bacterium]|nr:hypothetical protein [Acidobacteriota bacterium]